MVEYRGMQDLILEVVIPTEERIEIKDGVKKGTRQESSSRVMS